VKLLTTLLTITLMSTICYGSIQPVPVAQDAANHALVGAGVTKAVSAFLSSEDTFFLMSIIFIGKELTDKTGFSINDLVYDYVGYGLVMVNVKVEI